MSDEKKEQLAHETDPPEPASERTPRSKTATVYRVVYFAVHHDAEPPDPSITMGMLRGPDGDKPLLVTARSPLAALELDEVARGLYAVEGDIGKAIVIPDSAWHEFAPKAGWAGI